METVIDGHPEALAAALVTYGLRSSVEAVSVRADSLEEVMLALTGQEERA